MVKGVIIAVIALFLLAMPLVVALNFDVQYIDRGSTVVSQLNNPAKFDLVIDNKGPQDTFRVYSLIGMNIVPSTRFSVPTGEVVQPVSAYVPDVVIGKPGLYLLDYQVKGDNTNIFEDKFKIKLVDIKDALDIRAGDISIDDSSVNVTIKNLQNADLENLSFELKSEFFDFETGIFSLKPNEQASFVGSIDRGSIQKLVAGPYVITATTDVDGKEVKTNGIAIYLESRSISTEQSSKGWIVRQNIVTKTNTGNIPMSVEVRMKRDIITRLFTSYSLEPVVAERGALTTTYSWVKELGPQESLVIVSTTNYTLPFVLLILIIFIAIMVKIYLRTDVIVKKRVSYVRTKGGEFALKVRVHIKARKNVENVNVIDRIPPMAKLYEGYGKRPDRVDEATRRLFWSIPRLNSGEERVFSYIIYSKVNVLGRFELPPAAAVYNVDHKKGMVMSNKTYFVAEINSSDEDF